ncbi:cation transporter [Microbulbifer hainanensis]
MSDCGCGAEQAQELERRTLIWLLSINAFMFVAELVLGWLAQSTGLIADSLDMLADASVYGLSLYAVGKGVLHQAKAAQISGFLQIILGLGVLLEVLRRLFFGSEPQSLLIIAVGAAALVANVVCLALISKHREGGVHMRASWIFSTNDVIANLGVIVSGVLVAIMGSRFPDLIIGTIISIIVVRGGIKIIQEAKQTRDSSKNVNNA